MKFGNKLKQSSRFRIFKDIQNQKTRNLAIRNTRAVSVIISNIILIAAVISVGLVVLAWSQSQTSSYQNQYNGMVNANINQLQEKLVYEFVSVDGSQLNVYLLNCGSQNVSIAAVLVNGHLNSTAIQIHPLGGTSIIPTIDVSQQAYFTIPTYGTNPYTVKIVTGRGSVHVGSS